MKQKIIDLLSENFSKTHGGMSVIQLSEQLKIPILELKTHLNELYKDQKIKIRKGINGNLIYKK